MSVLVFDHDRDRTTRNKTKRFGFVTSMNDDRSGGKVFGMAVLKEAFNNRAKLWNEVSDALVICLSRKLSTHAVYLIF